MDGEGRPCNECTLFAARFVSSCIVCMTTVKQEYSPSRLSLISLLQIEVACGETAMSLGLSVVSRASLRRVPGEINRTQGRLGRAGYGAAAFE